MIKMFSVDYLYQSFQHDLTDVVYLLSMLFIYVGYGTLSLSPLHAKSQCQSARVVLGMSERWYRKEKTAECRERKPSEERVVFFTINRSRPKFGRMTNFFILFHGDDQWLSGVPAEWSSAFSIVQRLMCEESRVISRVAIFFCVQSPTFNGCRTVRSCRMAISFTVQN